MTVQTVTFDEACAHIAELLRGVSRGREVVVVEGTKPMARVVPVEAPRKPRIPGLNEGAIQTSADFDAPLPEGVGILERL
ncbi:MAG: toxin-antitoxin (TA) system antitoxin [Planctomycetota bacterium]